MPHLPNEQIHLWTVNAGSEVDSRVIDCCRAFLSNLEILRAEQFLFEKDRELYVISHALLRVMLSEFCDVSPNDWQFSQNTHGKPHVCDGFPQLRFNITHTKGLVACVVSTNHEVGVDAEFIEAPVELNLARKYFSQSENRYLERASKEKLHEAFFDIWTLKEAYAKARGLGLSIPFESFSVIPSIDHDAALSFTSGTVDDASMSRFFRIRPSPHHCLAVCVRCASHLPCYLIPRQLSPLAICSGLSERYAP